MTVWIVEISKGDDARILGIARTKERAELFLKDFVEAERVKLGAQWSHWNALHWRSVGGFSARAYEEEVLE